MKDTNLTRLAKFFACARIQISNESGKASAHATQNYHLDACTSQKDYNNNFRERL